MTPDELAAHVGVVKSTMANKAALIAKTLDLGMFEPDLTRVEMLERHPMAWIVQVNGFMVDARTLPEELQDEARRRPDPEPRGARVPVRLLDRDGLAPRAPPRIALKSQDV